MRKRDKDNNSRGYFGFGWGFELFNQNIQESKSQNFKLCKTAQGSYVASRMYDGPTITTLLSILNSSNHSNNK